MSPTPLRSPTPVLGWRWWLLPLLTAIAICSGVARPAEAGATPSKYVYELCASELPGGASPQTSFAVNPGVPVQAFNTCAQANGSLGMQQYGHAASTFAILGVTVPAPPGGYVGAETVTGGTAALGPGNDHVYAVEPGWPLSGESERTFHFPDSPPGPSPGGEGGFNLVWNCDGNYAPGCEAGPIVWVRDIAATEVDPKPPALSVQGSLLAGGVLRGHQNVATSASDVGGGVSRIEVSVNDLPAGQPSVANCNLARAENHSYEGPVALSVAPCPPKLDGDWRFDTASYPFHTGANKVQVCAFDYSSLTEGNKTCSEPATVNVNNTCAESTVVGGQLITAQFASTHEGQITVSHDQAARVTGELSDSAGDTISGATVCVEVQTEGTRRLRPVATTTTNANGRFTYRVRPGPNRKLLFGYRHDTFQVAHALHFYARAKPTIHLSRAQVGRGGTIRISGRLPGKHGCGRVVVLQASALHSSQWFTFHHATTNADGVYHSHYRFDETTRETTYRIRAVVPRQLGYPWEVGHSTPALVLVTG
jgi:hypothetical protein